MWHLSTIVKRILSLTLIATLAVAPVSTAFASCLPASTGMNMASAENQPDCDTPCKDCASGAMKKFCQGDCVCVKILIASPDFVAAAALPAARPVPGEITGPLAPAHPPDPPPPRSTLV